MRPTLAKRPRTLISLAAMLLLAGAAARQPTDKPALRTDARFVEKHKSFLEHRSADTKLLFLGASICEFWQVAGAEQYKAHFGKYVVDNFGISGDKTQNILWRIDQGELDGMDPKLVIIHTGNNNVEGDSVEDTATGITAVVKAVETKLPRTRVLLMEMFPRGADPEDPKVAALRAKIKAVNAIIAKLDDGNRTRVVDIGDKFLDRDGLLRYSMMNDAQHPTAKGYEVWGTEIQKTVDEMMAAPVIDAPAH